MKTWEMIKNLSENPNKKFISNYTKDSYYIAEVNNENLSIVDSYNNKPLIFISLKREWEEVKEPLTFGEILGYLKKEGVEYNPLSKVKVEYKDFASEYMYFSCLLKKLGNDFDAHDLAKIIDNGKWYIED